MIKKFAFLIALTSTLVGYNQTNNTSPYSYFGIGDTNQQMTVASSSMGGINVAQSYISELNFSNPAALAALRFTTFSMAGNFKALQIDDGSVSQNSSYTGLASLALGVPFGKKGGLMVGLQPNSSVGYSIADEHFDESNEIDEKSVFFGNGGTNRFYGSFGYEVSKGLSLGIEGEYIFGNIENSIINIRKNVSYNTRYRTISNVKGASIKLGTQYKHKLANDLIVKLGATLKLKNKLKANSEEYLYKFIYGSTGEQPKDTISSKQDIEGTISRPTSMVVGASFGKDNKWNLGLEFESQAAMNIDESVFKNDKIKYSSKSRFGIGGFYIPKTNSLTSYWKRVIYRAGLKYEKTGLAVNGTTSSTEFTPINDFGISFGLGLPIGNQLSQVNLGFEYGNRGNTTNGLIKENYFNLHLSFNLTDKWFRKNKIN